MLQKVEILEKKDLIIQLEASKSSFNDLFNNLLNETKGFKVSNYRKSFVKKIQAP